MVAIGFVVSVFLINCLVYRFFSRGSLGGRSPQPNFNTKLSFALWRWLGPLVIIGEAARKVGIQNWQPKVENLVISLILVGIGTSILTVSLCHLGEHFSVCHKALVPRKIVKSGPYKIIKHPIYFANSISFFSLVYLLESWLSFVVYIITVGIYLKAASEENKVLRSVGLK